MLKKYEITAKIKTNNYSDVEEVLYFNSQEEADTYAKEFAEERYFLNPILDIVELMDLCNLSEEDAREEFFKRLQNNILHSAKEVTVAE